MRKLLLRTFFGAVILLIAQVSTVFALPYSGAWLPNDGDVNFVSFTVLKGESNDYQVWMYDFDNQLESMMVLDSGYDVGATVDFTQGSDDWTANFGADSINLDDDPDFGIAFFDGSIFHYNYDWQLVDEGKSYRLSMGGMELLQIDAIPHSIPDATTLLLLGSAMLIGGVFGRKKVFRML